jgi:hypothetical protein
VFSSIKAFRGQSEEEGGTTFHTRSVSKFLCKVIPLTQLSNYPYYTCDYLKNQHLRAKWREMKLHTNANEDDPMTVHIPKHFIRTCRALPNLKVSFQTSLVSCAQIISIPPPEVHCPKLCLTAFCCYSVASYLLVRKMVHFRLAASLSSDTIPHGQYNRLVIKRIY